MNRLDCLGLLSSPGAERQAYIRSVHNVLGTQMKTTIIAIAIVLGIIETADAADLYWKIVDGSGKVLGNASTDTTDVSGLERVLQSTYPGIKLSIKDCRQPTLVEAMDPVYGKGWQCGMVVYRETVIHPPAPTEPVIRVPPSSSQWHYFGSDASNEILFTNESHRVTEGTLIWTEDYNAFALAEAASERSGIKVIAMDLDSAPNAVHRAAEEIVDADPVEIGSIHRTSGRAQKILYEIDCASRQMRTVQTIDSRGQVMDDLALGAQWFKPTLPGDTRWRLIQRECAQ